MKRRQSDWDHLIRLGALLALGLAVFIFIRPWFVPDDFGVYGHYRAGAILDGRELPLRFAGRESCETCHSDVVDLQDARASGHRRLACEGCHGPLAAHAAAPDEVRPALPAITPACVTCHEASAGRPSLVPQVVVADHSGGETCSSCHVAHTPGMF
jgi:hypothetical protein